MPATKLFYVKKYKYMRGLTDNELRLAIKPDLAGQKAVASWLWAMLNQHPETSLPQKKDHFFGSASVSLGTDWYYKYFEDLDRTKVIGEASTTYFMIEFPTGITNLTKIEFDDSLPVLPDELPELPDIKIV